MNQRMNENSQTDGRPYSVAMSAVKPAHWQERLMTALACASESNMRQLNVLLRGGLGLVFLFEMACWLELARFAPALLRMERPFFIFDIGLVGAGLCVTYLNWFARNWRTVAMAFCLSLVASRTLLALLINQDESLVLALLVLLLGCAVLVPWSVRWQGLLSLTGLIAFGVAALDGAIEPTDASRWLVLAGAGAFALSFTALKDQHRAQNRLIEEMLDKERRLARSQKVLRTLFDAVPDIVTLTRFSDGKLFEVNDELLRRTGLTREQALSTSVIQANAWVRPEERDKYVQRLKATGRVRNLEADFRLNGVVAPYLMSSVSLEIDGEVYALNVARDATQIKENERALRETQERLREQVERLTATEARLRTEVADRRQAQARVAKSEAMLRGMFDAIPDIIITRRGDVVGDVNEEFVKRAGLSRAQVLGRRVEEATLFLRAEDRAEFLRRVRADGIVRNFQADL